MTAPATDDDDSLLLRSKCAVPEPPRFMVVRPRLSERLECGTRDPLTVVTGPAGSGKTQAVATWVREGRAADAVAWVTIEEGDSDPDVFWMYVVEALRQAGLPLPNAVTELAPPASTDPVFLAHLAAQLATQRRTVVLVLDDVSSAPDCRWGNDLDFVLRHSGGQLRLVLVGRWDPPLPLYRYRLAGTLTEVRSDDLAFTEAEAAQLLALHGIRLSPSGLASLLRHTEGWAAGLRLFAMALAGHDDADSVLSTIGGDEATIAEYFVGEVLRAQPPDVRRVLLHTSILDTVTPELAQLLTGRSDAGRVLAGLERENAFVQSAGSEPAAYRYHRLFGELLRAQLAYESPQQLRELHHRAADWLAARGRTVEAVDHAVRAGDWDAATGFAVEDYAIGQLVLGGGADRLGRLLRDLPDEGDSPHSAVVGAALALTDADRGRAAKQLTCAEELAEAQPSGPGNAVATAIAVLGLLVADPSPSACDGLEQAAAAEALLAAAPSGPLDRHPEMRALVLAAKGAAQSLDGTVEAAVATYADAAAAASGTGCEPLRVECLQQLALLEAYRGRLRRATTAAVQALELAGRSPGDPRMRPATAHVTLAWVAVEHYDVEAGWRHLRAAEAMFDKRPGGLPATALAVVKARLLRARGEFRGALAALERDSDASVPVWLAREVVLSRARVLIAGGRPGDALTVLDRFSDDGCPDAVTVLAEALSTGVDPARAQRLATSVTQSADVPAAAGVAAWLTLAALAADRGETGAAREALRQALRLAEPEAQRRQIGEAGPRLRRLLRDDPELGDRYRSLGRGTQPARAPAAPAPAKPVVVEKLSKRELEVLRYVEAMLPTEEIAGAMYVSVNTVKTHVRSILRKLSASRRNEAVRRARELGLI